VSPLPAAARADGLLYLKLVLMSALWGGQWVAGRHIAPMLPHYATGAARFLIRCFWPRCCCIRNAVCRACVRAFFGTVLTFFWYLECVQRFGPARAAAFINLVPVFGVFAGWLVLGEPLFVSVITGGVLVIIGVALINRMPAPVQVADGSIERRNPGR